MLCECMYVILLFGVCSAAQSSALLDYAVVLKLSDKIGGGTNDKVFLTVVGDVGEISEQEIIGEFDSNGVERQTLKSVYIGPVCEVSIKTVGSTSFGDWHLDYVNVTDPITPHVTTFPFKRWIKGNVETERKAARDGNWGQWSMWSPCSGCDGISNRSRECNSPMPACGGDVCTGRDYELVNCSRKDCTINPTQSTSRTMTTNHITLTETTITPTITSQPIKGEKGLVLPIAVGVGVACAVIIIIIVIVIVVVCCRHKRRPKSRRYSGRQSADIVATSPHIYDETTFTYRDNQGTYSHTYAVPDGKTVAPQDVKTLTPSQALIETETNEYDLPNGVRNSNYYENALELKTADKNLVAMPDSSTPKPPKPPVEEAFYMLPDSLVVTEPSALEDIAGSNQDVSTDEEKPITVIPTMNNEPVYGHGDLDASGDSAYVTPVIPVTGYFDMSGHLSSASNKSADEWYSNTLYQKTDD